jgi:GMP reductase
MVQEIILHGGVDIVKCGNSFGGACRTKNKTGIGRPMFSTVIDCSNSAHGLKSGHKKMGLICADGGCKDVGDICKAIGGGADFVMLGSLFAGCDENEGDWEYEDCKALARKKNLKFYGMSSHHAQIKHYNEIREYATSEGTTISVPYKGMVQDVVRDILGGIRSCCSYSGIDEIENLHKAANFIRGIN